MYAIIDIETTGGSATRSKITEIAIYKHDGERVVDEFQTLINPQTAIPYNIVKLTGITDEMVADAPLFFDVAAKIDEFTKDCVFVAHNVNFDYGFVKAEFDRIGISYRRKKLCTVRLSRKLLPGKFSYSLGKLCASENIILNDRHRAAGDAKATSILFGRLLQLDKEDYIQKALNPQSLEALMPPNLPKSDFLGLPNAQGLYYFLNQKREIVYIGKAKDIKKRVHSHFSGNSNTKSKYYFVKNIYGVDFKLIPDNLLLDIIEATEIKKHWPRYNSSMKRITLNHGLFSYEDRNGYLRFSIGKCGKHDKPLKSFKNLSELKHLLRIMVMENDLCPRLSGLQPISSGKCNYIEQVNCQGACIQNETAEDYNRRVKKAIEEYITHQSSYVLTEPCIKDKSNCAVVLVEKGRYKGYGIIPIQSNLKDIGFIKSQINTAYDDQDMSILVNSYFRKAKEENIVFLN